MDDFKFGKRKCTRKSLKYFSSQDPEVDGHAHAGPQPRLNPSLNQGPGSALSLKEALSVR